jgi:hypothetical protein
VIAVQDLDAGAFGDVAGGHDARALAEIDSRLGPSTSMRIATPLRFSTMSVTSSRTPATEENSCSTLSIWTRVIAAPCSETAARGAARCRASGRSPARAVRRPPSPARRVVARLHVKLRGLDQFCQFLWIMRPSIPVRGSKGGRPRIKNDGQARPAVDAGARNSSASDAAALRAGGSRCARSGSRRGST